MIDHTLTPILSKSAPFTCFAILTTQNLVSLSRKSSPDFPKQKFEMPPGTTILPRRIPPGLHTCMPSPQPEYTFPAVSHLIPSGAPVSAIAKTRRFVRNLEPWRTSTSNANLCVNHLSLGHLYVVEKLTCVKIDYHLFLLLHESNQYPLHTWSFRRVRSKDHLGGQNQLL